LMPAGDICLLTAGWPTRQSMLNANIWKNSTKPLVNHRERTS
jgi:hypothetical protein